MFKVGDKVTLVNPQGCVFPGKTITEVILGMDRMPGEGNSKILQVGYKIEPTDTPWFCFPPEQLRLPKIYVFINSQMSEWHTALAFSEDGFVLANHTSSTPEWSKHDMGITSDWKHERYKAYFPNGFELMWLEGNPLQYPDFVPVYERHKTIPEAEHEKVDKILHEATEDFHRNRR